MKMVTGQFNDAFLPIMDGVTNVVVNYASWFWRTHGVGYVVTPDSPGYVDKTPYPVLRYPSVPIPFRKPYRQGLPYLDAQFMEQVRQIPFDLVHAHTPFSAGHVALYVARKREIPVIASFHSKYYDDLYAALKVEAAARYGVRRIVDFYESVDQVWTVNRGTAETLHEYGFKGNIEIIRNGSDFVPPTDKNACRKQADEQFGLGGTIPVLLYVGQHVWQKNLKTLFEALALCRDKGLSFQMVMVGSGYAEEELKELCVTLGLSQQVRFLGTIHDREQLKRLYCRADLFFFPSVYDNASIALREAAAVACPALLVRGSNTAEDVVDGENGFLADNTPESLSTRLIEAVETPGALEAAGLGARQTIHVLWDEIMEEVEGRYLELMKSGTHQSRRMIVPVSPMNFSGEFKRNQKSFQQRFRLIRRRVTRMVRRLL